MHNLLIFNPVSGKSDSKKEYIGEIITKLSQNGNVVTVYQTQKQGDAQEYIGNLQDAFCDRVICCGGDGTLHEVINGIMQKGWNVPVGYIPAGSTNDYANNLGITRNSALECLETGILTAIDIGCANGTFFNYVAAFGLFTNISYATPQKIKNTFGYFAYLLEGIKQLTDVVPKHVSFCVDGKWTESDMIVGMITNSFSVGGIKNYRRNNVKLDDGMLEYLFIKYPKNLIELQATISVLLSEKIDERYMYYGQFTTMEIESEAMEWTLDGENGGLQDKMRIVTYPGAVNIFCGNK